MIIGKKEQGIIDKKSMIIKVQKVSIQKEQLKCVKIIHNNKYLIIVSNVIKTFVLSALFMV